MAQHGVIHELKYTKNIDYFIVVILPYLEIYFREQPSHDISLHAVDSVCDISELMFGARVVPHRFKLASSLLTGVLHVSELDEFLAKIYVLKHSDAKLSKPVYPAYHGYLKSKKYLCIHPKFKPTELLHNMNQKYFKDFIDKNSCCIDSCETYIIGHPMEKLNVNFGGEIDNFIDTLAFLHYCKLFITSESQWHYIALLCNCRNVIVYSSNSQNILEKIDNSSAPTNLFHYIPFQNNIYVTNDLHSDEVHTLIKSILDS